ncbi:hypothetical protein HDU98_012132 [Podochytrium sp. JEL0797]|nr:hypothetical protein HDU98_012132 [Podochytrium sp. JEL0797]
MTSNTVQSCDEIWLCWHDYNATDDTKLSIKEGELIHVYKKASTDWWYGVSNGIQGWFPSNFVRRVDGAESAPADSANDQQLGSGIDDAISCEAYDGRGYHYNNQTGEIVWDHEPTSSSATVVDGSESIPSGSASPATTTSPYDTNLLHKDVPPDWSMFEAAGQFAWINTKTGAIQYTRPENPMQGVETDVAGMSIEGRGGIFESQMKLPSSREMVSEGQARCARINSTLDALLSEIRLSAIADSGTALLSSAKAVSSQVGDLVSFVEDGVTPAFVSVEVADDLEERKVQLSESVQQLITTSTNASSLFSSSNVASEIADSANGVKRVLSAFLVSFKVAVQDLESGGSGNLGSRQVEMDPPTGTLPSPTKTLISQGPVLDNETDWYLGVDHDPKDVAFDQSGELKGATLQALVELLTAHKAFDPVFAHSFLLTYRSFTNISELLALLKARYALDPPPSLNAVEYEKWSGGKRDIVRLRVYNILKMWAETHCSTSDEDARALQDIYQFAQHEMSKDFPKLSLQLSHLVSRRQESSDSSIRVLIPHRPKDAPPPILPMGLRAKKFKLVEIDPIEVARQLTMMEKSVFDKIQPAELFGRAWSKSNGLELSPNVRAMSVLSNRIAGWVIQTILTEADVKKRAGLLKHIISVAKECLALNNFCTVATIVGALNSAAVFRLQKTWTRAGKHVTVFKELHRLMDIHANFSRYRAAIKKASLPCVPYFALYLTDLFYVDLGSKNFLLEHEEDPNAVAPASRLINFSKRAKYAHVVREIQRYQSAHYHLAEVLELQEFLRNSFSEDGCGPDGWFDLSLRVEPREGSL